MGCVGRRICRHCGWQHQSHCRRKNVYPPCVWRRLRRHCVNRGQHHRSDWRQHGGIHVRSIHPWRRVWRKCRTGARDSLFNPLHNRGACHRHNHGGGCRRRQHLRQRVRRRRQCQCGHFPRDETFRLLLARLADKRFDAQPSRRHILKLQGRWLPVVCQHPRRQHFWKRVWRRSGLQKG